MLKKIGNLVSLFGEWGKAAQVELDALKVAHALTQAEKVQARAKTVIGPTTPTQITHVANTDKYVIVTKQAVSQLQNIADDFPGVEAATEAISNLPRGVMTPTTSCAVFETRIQACRVNLEQTNRVTRVMEQDLLRRTIDALTFWK